VERLALFNKSLRVADLDKVPIITLAIIGIIFLAAKHQQEPSAITNLVEWEIKLCFSLCLILLGVQLFQLVPRFSLAMARRGSEMTPDQGKYLLHDPDFGDDMLRRLNSLRSSALFTDTILCVEHEEFPCHRNVLAASSPYFEAMFTSDLRESHEMKISFSDVSAWTLKRIIDYAYSGHLEINNDNAQEMMAAGNQFAYPRIVDACAEFLRKQLHPSNCLEIENFALHHNCSKLHKEANAFILENFTSVVDHEEFLELSPERLKEYISSDFIDVRNEEIVFEAVMRWVKFDVDERRNYLPELLENVRLGVLDMHSLSLIERDPLVAASPECYSLVTRAQQLKTSMEGQLGKRRRSMQDNQVHCLCPSWYDLACFTCVTVIVCYINKALTGSY
jgi:hypothetical protein